uniref:uncharacterized protein zgc:162608 isoform X1 n=1 Tax=Doryrhamphus excisus TaxID=161450 RepID=UPI0025ADAB13|nr:uncharacterized protein zgc:162608 isoform X1 [Doryrhamphus excisus]XP_057936150.1 uncharacterized protein zgc:162608 isoform X1 [Doryrhamphus excisus]
MHLEKVIFTIFNLAILAVSAFPRHRDSREATWTDYMANQAHHKTKLTKDVDKIYKSHIDDSGLYDRGEDDHNKNQVSEEMQLKINMEAERLRARLRQELSELRERLALSPAHRSSTLASVRDRLAPLAQQLHSSLGSSTNSLCLQLGLSLQSPEDPEAFQWMTQTLEQGTSELVDMLDGFTAQTTQAMEHLREVSEAANMGILTEFSSRLGQEVTSLKTEVQNELETLKAELLKADAAAAVERFCQNSAHRLHFQARLERLFTGMEEELEVQSGPTFSESGGSLQEDFSLKFSALMRDILHSVQ